MDDTKRLAIISVRQIKKVTQQTMKNKTLSNLCLAFGLFSLLSGCASTKVTNREQLVTGAIPKPAQIWVYDFVATPDDVPANSALAGESDLNSTQQTSAQIAEGKKLGSQIATELVAQIRYLGMNSSVASAESKPQINDLVLRGYLLSIQEGDAAKRVAIGFGSGASELRVMVEGYQVTANGQRELGSGTVEASGSKSPGAVLGVATFLATKNPAGLIISGGMHVYGEASGSSKVEGRAKATAKEISGVLKQRFQQQGWID